MSGQPEADPRLVEVVARAMRETPPDGPIAANVLAAVRAYDAERTRRNVVVRDECPCCDEFSGGGYCAECIERGCP